MFVYRPNISVQIRLPLIFSIKSFINNLQQLKHYDNGDKESD